MSMLKKNGTPKKKTLPKSVARSGKRARRTFAQAHDSAARKHGEGQRAMRSAWTALERSHEKVGRRWKKKPVATASPEPVAQSRSATGELDGTESKKDLYRIAQTLHIHGRSTMSKKQLASAVHDAQSSETATPLPG